LTDDTTYILTAEMDVDSFAWLDGLRSFHFPPARNVLSAHLTLFHRLSAQQVKCLCATKLPPAAIELEFDKVRFLGAGVAINVKSPNLERLRGDIAAAIGGELSRQDGQKWMPHVTVQNKAAPTAAKDLFRSLDSEFASRSGDATGLLVWEYLGGPWKLVRRIPFAI
jgi:hypothetical protein